MTTMTEEDRTCYLNFCCGMLMGTILAIRDLVQEPEQTRIKECLETVEPLLARVYKFQDQV